MKIIRSLFLIPFSLALLQPLQAAPVQVHFAQSAPTVDPYDHLGSAHNKVYRTPGQTWNDVQLIQRFAVTYDAMQTPAEVKFYFGAPEQPATLDATVAHEAGPVGEDLSPLAIGHFNILTRPGHTDRMFRGLIDQIRVDGSRFDRSSVLTLEQIRNIQQRKAERP